MTVTRSQRPRFRSSDLSRDVASVFEAASERDVEITRRDGESLILMPQHAADERDELLQVAAQLIAAATADEGDLGERFAQQFPWMYALSDADRDACAVALVRASRASFSTGQPHLVLSEMISWRESAEAIAAGLRNEAVEWNSAAK